VNKLQKKHDPEAKLAMKEKKPTAPEPPPLIEPIAADQTNSGEFKSGGSGCLFPNILK
jgi:hypothetical protein